MASLKEKPDPLEFARIVAERHLEIGKLLTVYFTKPREENQEMKEEKKTCKHTRNFGER